MSQFERAILVLYPQRTRSDFERVAAEVGLLHRETRPGDGLRSAYEQVWTTPNGLGAVNYLEDPLAGLNYLSIRGSEVAHFVGAFARRLEVYDRADALVLAEGAVEHDDQVESIVRLAVVSPEYDPGAFAVFEAYALQGDDPLLREATVDAMGYRAWPEFKPLLERIVASDPLESIREHAGTVLRSAYLE